MAIVIRLIAYTILVCSWFLPAAQAVNRTPIRYRPFYCRNGWSVSQTFRCDHFKHCIDGSDEEGCEPAAFVEVPSPNATVQVGNWLNLTCTARGVPAPIIEWKMNDKQPEAFCDWISEAGLGQLSCRMRLIDSGNYTCIGRQLNKTIVTTPTVVRVIGNVCKKGYFNEVGKKKMCLKCFCSGVSNLCQAADLFRWNYTMAMNDWKMKYATVDDIHSPRIQVYEHIWEASKNKTPYYFLPFRFTQYQVGSYGEKFRYNIWIDNSSYSHNQPDVILKGYNTTLVYTHMLSLIPNQPNLVVFRFNEINLRKPGGERATREDVMTVLAFIDTFLIRMYPVNGSFIPASTQMVMDASTNLSYHGLGKVTRVEQCRCPHGYRGSSCEWCDFGYNRVQKFLRTGACMPWEWHRAEYEKVSTTTIRNWHYV